MGTYAYIARDKAGEKVTGRLAGSSEQVILAELQARSLAPIRVQPIAERPRLRRGIGTRQLAQLYRQLSDLLRAGVPLLRTLRLLGRGKANPRVASVMNAIADAVADGDPLADAMAGHDEMFPAIQVAMVRAGERGGFLEQVLQRLAVFLEHQADLRSRVIGNLIYPILLLIIGAGIVTFALVFLVPKFESFYSRIELPLPTKVLLGSSAFMQKHWLLVLAGMITVVALLWFALRRPEVRRHVAVWQLRVPKAGEMVRDLAVARFARILGTLLENGIPLLTAMQISRDSAGHVLLSEAIDEAVESVRRGETLAEPLAASGMFSDEMVEMISVGESANNLADVLVALADTVEKRVDRTMAAALRILEPLLLLAMASVVMFIFIALVVPMLRLSSGL